MSKLKPEIHFNLYDTDSYIHYLDSAYKSITSWCKCECANCVLHLEENDVCMGSLLGEAWRRADSMKSITEWFNSISK